MTIYQLKATGPNTNGTGINSMYSRDVFRTVEAAEKHVEEFLDRCCDDSYFSLVRNETEIFFLELTLHS